jgi:hypothetical protein
MRDAAVNANARARVSKDEDERCALMLRDAALRAAPQHEGRRRCRRVERRTNLWL